MKNKKVIYFFAISFSIFFSLIYFFVFHYYIPTNENGEKFILYMNQIGLYKNVENAQKVEVSLEKHDMEAYIYKNDDLYIVVSGIGEKKETEENGEQLKTLSYSYLLKKLEISDSKIIAYAKTKDYEKVLELIQNQSQGNAQ